jgi:hypothetical protein
MKRPSYTPSENGDVSIKTYSSGKRIKSGTCTAVDMGARVYREDIAPLVMPQTSPRLTSSVRCVGIQPLAAGIS